MRFASCMLALALVASSAGCATHFSAQRVRGEILRQRGIDPRSTLELNLGRATTWLIRQALTAEDGELPFRGITQLSLAVYEVDPARGPAIDVTQFDVHGWEPVVRAHTEKHSGMVLVRGSRRWNIPGFDDAARAPVGDLVVVGAGSERVVYARLRGSLSAELPTALGDLLREGGPDEVKRVIGELAGSE